MATKKLLTYAETGNSIAVADDADNASTVAMRDGNGDLAAKKLHGNIHNTGTRDDKLLAITATHTVGTTPATVFDCDATGGAFTVTLPSAVGLTDRVYTFVKTDVSANAVTVDGAGSELINGAATSVLASQYDALRIISNGTKWLKI